jgi:hypothetical protein
METSYLTGLRKQTDKRCSTGDSTLQAQTPGINEPKKWEVSKCNTHYFYDTRTHAHTHFTLCNNILAQKLRGWTCGENESCSEHNVIRFDIETGTTICNAADLSWKRYHIKTEDWGKFENELASNLLTGFGCVNN